MRKQRKMSHVTIVGPSKSVVKSRLSSMLQKYATVEKQTATPSVAIIMGSDSDLPVMKDAAEVLTSFGISFELTIVSAHRTPERMHSFAISAKERGIQVIISGAGGAAHLPGMVASLTPLPVIGVPVKTSSMSGMDSLLSIGQMPKGIPVATVAAGNAANAGFLAARMLASTDSDLWDRVTKYQQELMDTVLLKAKRLEVVRFGEILERLTVFSFLLQHQLYLYPMPSLMRRIVMCMNPNYQLQVTIGGARPRVEFIIIHH